MLSQKWEPGIFLEGKERPARRTDNLTAICEPLENFGASTSHNPMEIYELLQG
jgi:hypothetical protein